MSHRILFDISAHGHGHLAQTARVVAVLRRTLPEFELLVRTELPRSLVEVRLGAVEHVDDSGTGRALIMDAEIQVDRPATRAYYLALHERFESHVTELRRDLLAHRVDLVCCNAGYLALAAAHAAGIRSCLFCSLAWDEILADLFPADPAMNAVVGTITRSYARADLCFRLRPGMPMRSLRGEDVTAVLARRGRDVRGALRRQLGQDTRPIVLFAFGDWTVRRPSFLELPAPIRFIVPPRWMAGASHLVCGAELPFHFRDLIASADLVISKTGYGVVTELALDGQGVILVERPGWPEEAHLLRWLRRYTWLEVIPNLETLTPSCLGNALERRNGDRTTYSNVQTGGEDRIISCLLQSLTA